MSREKIAKGLWLLQLALEAAMGIHFSTAITREYIDSLQPQAVCELCNIAPPRSLLEIILNKHQFVFLWLPMLLVSLVSAYVLFIKKKRTPKISVALVSVVAKIGYIYICSLIYSALP